MSITGATRGEYFGEKIVASYAEAVAKGYRHPNCRHSSRIYIPGMYFQDPDRIDPGDYKATQKLRALEREVRKYKRAKATALTPEAKQRATAQIMAGQAKIRQHVKETGIPRNRFREQIEKAL